MGCNSDYMNPTTKERELRETAVLYDFALRQVYGEHVKPCNKLAAALKTSYPSEDLTEELCSLLRGLDLKKFEEVVYNAREKHSRQLADWWERHLAADDQRIKQEIEHKYGKDPVLKEFIGLNAAYVKAGISDVKNDSLLRSYMTSYAPAVERRAKHLAHLPFYQFKDALTVAQAYRPGKTLLNYSYRQNREFSSAMGYISLMEKLSTTTGESGLKVVLKELNNKNSPACHFFETFWTEVLRCCEASGLQAEFQYCHDGGGMESWYEVNLIVPVQG